MEIALQDERKCSLSVSMRKNIYIILREITNNFIATIFAVNIGRNFCFSVSFTLRNMFWLDSNKNNL